ncbi:MAG TPA: 23S rRNA (cytidine(2498)-2'-O)-methyltransferase RlmM [Casimicrobiaceae bacterium]|nr:23S rRNA (cytidine(2498)-2'-O)-methyltransferase RlmM [Casimicrobiaceae bacterium]
MLNRVLALCRAGFEAEAARDLAELGARTGVRLTTLTEPGFAIASIGAGDPPSLGRWSTALAAADPVFTRTVVFGTGPHRIAPADARARPDRITPLVAAVEALRPDAPFVSMWLEYPDTNEGKALSSLTRSLEARLGAALQERRLLDLSAPHRPRLHVMLRDGATAWVGASTQDTGSPWPMGIPRLRMPGGAPSRSTQKLAEAFVTFLGDDEPALVRAGMRAVDLGAAPGGWSWQLARRGVRVTAVDNGPLKGEVAQDPLVTHVREDGLRYRPRKPVDWVVCDIVESPARIATLIGRWIAEGAGKRAIFNLKLPMKKRWDEVQRCRDIIATELARTRTDGVLRMRQLYHDREEVTAYLARSA